MGFVIDVPIFEKFHHAVFEGEGNENNGTGEECPFCFQNHFYAAFKLNFLYGS